MPSFTENKILPYSAKQMYELVLGIEQYPEFLPWCRQAKIIQKVSDENLIADLLINFRNFFEKYRSDVKHGKLENGYFIDVTAIEGPFKNLINKWEFLEAEGGKSCQTNFFITFEFNSVLLSKIIGGIFENAARKMMAAFEERAKLLS